MRRPAFTALIIRAVMAGLVPAIHVFGSTKNRHKAGHDESGVSE
jgi:hypothetical protein